MPILLLTKKHKGHLTLVKIETLIYKRKWKNLRVISYGISAIRIRRPFQSVPIPKIMVIVVIELLLRINLIKFSLLHIMKGNARIGLIY